MTSGNVSNMLMNSVNTKTVDVTIRKEDVHFDYTNFDAMLADVSNRETPAVNTKDNSVNQPQEIKAEANGFSKSKISADKAEKTSAEDTQPVDESEIAEKIEKFVEGVKKVIKENLGVTDEEIEDAMEVLGLSVIDLINPQNLANLVLELNGENDSVSLLISDEFNAVFDQVGMLVNQLLEETQVNPTQIKDIMISLEMPVEDGQISVKENSVLVTETKEETPLVATVDVNDVTKADTNIVSDDSSVTEELAENVEVIKTEQPTDNNNEQQTSDSDLSKKENIEDNASTTELREDNPVGFTETIDQMEFSKAEQTVTLPTGEKVQVQEMLDQIVEQAKVMTDTESTTMEMTLKPEGLGKIYMEVTQKGSEITAKILTENETVKEALENQMAALRNQFNSNSTKVTSIEVSVGAHEFERNLEEDARQQQNSEDQANQSNKRRTRIDLNNLDELSGLMTEEEQLVAQIMRENGNTLNYQA